MRKLLHNSERFEYHASPRMVPHVYKPEVKYVKLTIDKYIPHLRKTRLFCKRIWHVAAVIFIGALELEDQLEADFPDGNVEFG
ncbi:unnamed protein product [Miscanthus lutarioriparius]|uniref:Uncharacterized protein n=1 Tax=Miscanthus lutarioriparius TaxID=422564 RepID=A0A811QFG0_9POAL|nr:unnamed protein product [Miscanthus lutarioriparius]